MSAQQYQRNRSRAHRRQRNGYRGEHRRQRNDYRGEHRRQRNDYPDEHRQRLVGKLDSVTIKGFKSVKDATLNLRDINILVGANGAGKSNFLCFFDMLSWMIKAVNLREYVGIKGGASDLLFNGSKITRVIESVIKFTTQSGQTEYAFNLQHAEDDSFVFSKEEYRYNPLRVGDKTKTNKGDWNDLGVGHREAKITEKETQDRTGQILKRMLLNCSIYQFHDTSDTSLLKQRAWLEDNRFLKSTGVNLAAILYNLKKNKPSVYQNIVETIRKVLPSFRDFELEPSYNKLHLAWIQKDNPDKIFPSHLTSDGSLRFFALVTLLSMPENRSADIILLDEPELGLHPYAITVLAELIKVKAKTKQVIIATQSPLLMNEFQPEDIVVTEAEKGNVTTFKRLDKNELKSWLDDYYAMGDLWQKNIFGGNPK